MTNTREQNGKTKVETWAYPELKIQEKNESDSIISSLQDSKVIEANLIKQVQDISYQSGYQAGFEVGYREAKEKTINDMHAQLKQEYEGAFIEKIQAMTLLVEAFDAPMQHLENDLEKLMVSMVSKISQKLVHDELKTSVNHIQSLVKKVLSMVPSDVCTTTIFVNAEDEALLKELVADKAHIALQVDSALLRGECHFKNDSSEVHATIAERIDHIIENLNIHGLDQGVEGDEA